MARVLFIDDEEFHTVDVLKGAGWSAQRVADIASLDDSTLTDAHIICVDIHGVGKSMGFSQEGLGLVGAIKERYPNKKVLVYSSKRRGDRFAEELYAADCQLPKDTDPYRFVSTIEEFAKQCFCWDECCRRAYENFRDQFHSKMAYEEFEVAIVKSIASGEFNSTKFARLAGASLDVASKLASIFSLLLSG